MVEHDDILERRIVRSLDGELSEDEQLELDRELIRNPAARCLFEEYRAVDAAAASAFSLIRDAEFTLHPVPQAFAQRRDGWRFRAFWLIPGAIAAALLALIVPKPAMDPVAPPASAPPGASWSAVENDGLIRPISSTPSVHRSTGRDLVGVVGEDGNIYWIEVQRTRTLRLPNGKPGALANQF
jgi:anti-sigma factor RsiW